MLMLMIKIELATRNTPICQLCYDALTLRSDAHCGIYPRGFSGVWRPEGQLDTVDGGVGVRIRAMKRTVVVSAIFYLGFDLACCQQVLGDRQIWTACRRDGVARAAPAAAVGRAATAATICGQR